MERTFRDKWVAALRSGKYKQTTGVLRDIDRHGNEEKHMCCLGVACDIYDPSRWEKRKGGFGDGSVSYRYVAEMPGDVDRIGSIPDDILHVIRLKPLQHANLFELNDRQGKTFAEIADYIEENL